MNAKNNLYIHSIELHNYRQYYGTCKFEFSTNPDKNFSIIKGSNGSGKTTLLRSLYFGLYGKENRTIDESGFPIINSRVFRESEVGETFNLKVELKIGNSEKALYTITREIRCYKKSGNDAIRKIQDVPLPEGIVPEFHQSIEYDHPIRGWISYKLFESAVNQILPKNLSNFFLFDGEELIDFFEAGLARVKDGIESISQITLIINAIEHLEAVKNEFRKRTGNNLNEKERMLFNFINEKESEIKGYKDQKITDETELDEIRAELNKVEQDLRNSNVEAVIANRNTLKLLEDEKLALTENIQNEEDQRVNKVLELGPKAYLLKGLIFTNNLLDKATTEGKLPPPINRKFLNELLESGKCICGSEIIGSRKEKLLNLLDEFKQTSDLSEIAKDGPFLTSQILESISSLNTESSHLVTKLEREYDTLDDYENQINQLQNKLKDFDDDTISTLGSRAATLRDKKIKKESSILYLSNRIKEETERKTKVETKYLQIQARNAAYEIILKKIKLCNESMEHLESIKGNLVSKVKKIVEEKTKESFFNIIWKKKTYTNLRINEDYEILIDHVDKFNPGKDLSAGEKLFLALSFIAALREITGFPFPLVIDTPLGRVSGKQKIMVAENLPNYLPGRQMIMLVTDTEYNSPVIDDLTNRSLGAFRDKILPYVGKEYAIEYEESKRGIKIIESKI